MVFIHVGFF
jgi:4-carboxymuconolactone decarboxylase